jgi:hypothetical protein
MISEALKNKWMIQAWSLVKEKINLIKFNLRLKRKQYCSQVWKVLTQTMKHWCKYFQTKNKWINNQF